jgi:hypothetical protein
VLLIGGMRYAFVAAARVLPWLNAPLPPSTARKTVAAFQGVLLLLADARLLPRPAALCVVLLALALLVWSFGRDVLWLWRTSPVRAVTGSEGAREPVAFPEPARVAFPKPALPGVEDRAEEVLEAARAV